MLASLAPLSRLSLSQLPLSALSAAAAAAAPPVRLRLGTIKPQLNHPDDAQECVWEKTTPLSGKNNTKPTIRAPGFLRGALPGRVLFPCWCGRSGGAPTSASASMTATDGPLARLTIERHPALGSAGQHASVDVRGLGTLLSFSVHSFLICWLLEYSVMLV